MWPEFIATQKNAFLKYERRNKKKRGEVRNEALI
jgi:hypothetical protein